MKVGDYEFVRAAESEGKVRFLVLRHYDHGTQIWVRAKMRKEWKCRVTEQPIRKGDIAWRPVTDANNRMHRISGGGISHLIDKQIDLEASQESQ